MGYDLDRFVDQETATNFACPICGEVFSIKNGKQEPINGNKGGHKFCEDCIKNWLQRQKCCPICRDPLDVHNLQNLDWFTTNIHSKLKIYCKYKNDGCNVIGYLESIEKHENNCPQGPKKCSKCNFLIPKSTIHLERDCINVLLETLKTANNENTVRIIGILKNDIDQLLNERDLYKENLEKKHNEAARLSMKNAQLADQINQLNLSLKQLQNDFITLKQQKKKSPVDMPELIKSCDTIENNYQKVKYLIEQSNAYVDYKDEFGNTALMKASIRGHLDIIQLLLENGAHINIKNNYGNTALIAASTIGKLNSVKMLVEKGANVNMKDNNGRTALMKAEKDDVREYLTSVGAN